MDVIEETLAQREATHGTFSMTATTAQEIKAAFKTGGHFENLPSDMQEALEMIATKQARILNGSMYTLEHWLDIAGYAMLIAKTLEEKGKEGVPF